MQTSILLCYRSEIITRVLPNSGGLIHMDVQSACVGVWVKGMRGWMESVSDSCFVLIIVLENLRELWHGMDGEPSHAHPHTHLHILRNMHDFRVFIWVFRALDLD